eukprot:m.64505 g.64505  ORF g.64505 m.64505 type:complete len:59 (+) comp23439_c0_seq1:431-607(+)
MRNKQTTNNQKLSIFGVDVISSTRDLGLDFERSTSGRRRTYNDVGGSTMNRWMYREHL